MVDSIEAAILQLKQRKEALSRKKEAIFIQIDGEIDKIEKGIEALQNLRSTDHLRTSVECIEAERITPIDAARGLFEREPKKKIYPRDVREELESLRKDGRLASGAENLLQTAHWAIRSLQESGVIRKQKKGGGKEKWYLKA